MAANVGGAIAYQWTGREARRRVLMAYSSSLAPSRTWPRTDWSPDWTGLDTSDRRLGGAAMLQGMMRYMPFTSASCLWRLEYFLYL